MSAPLRIGILGTASIAKRYIIPALLEMPETYTLYAVARRKIKQDLIQDVTLIEGYDNLLSKDFIDAIYIPLPNALHYEWVKKALKNGIHVLVEKSLTCNFNNTIELIELAKNKNLVLVENFQFRFHRQLKVIKELLKSGRIGKLHTLRSSFGFPPFADDDNIRYNAALGGGALLDAGAYGFQIAQEFLGSDISVIGAKSVFPAERDVDISGAAFITQNYGDVIAQTAFGFEHFYQCNVELWGGEGKISTERIFTAPPGFTTEIKIETKSGMEILQVEADNHFHNMLLYFYDLCTGKKSADDEMNRNYHQARLIEEFKKRLHVE